MRGFPPAWLQLIKWDIEGLSPIHSVASLLKDMLTELHWTYSDTGLAMHKCLHKPPKDVHCDDFVTRDCSAILGDRNKIVIDHVEKLMAYLIQHAPGGLHSHMRGGFSFASQFVWISVNEKSSEPLLNILANYDVSTGRRMLALVLNAYKEERRNIAGSAAETVEEQTARIEKEVDALTLWSEFRRYEDGQCPDRMAKRMLEKATGYKDIYPSDKYRVDNPVCVQRLVHDKGLPSSVEYCRWEFRSGIDYPAFVLPVSITILSVLSIGSFLWGQQVYGP